MEGRITNIRKIHEDERTWLVVFETHKDEDGLGAFLSGTTSSLLFPSVFISTNSFHIALAIWAACLWVSFQGNRISSSLVLVSVQDIVVETQWLLLGWRGAKCYGDL